MKPYADDSASATIGGLTVENGRDCLSLYGSLDLTRDKAGLAKARQLHDLLHSAVKALENDPALPDVAPGPDAPRIVTNPFG